MKESKTVPGVPRRACLQELTPEEMAIFNVMQSVEKLGGSEKLTRCSVMLINAMTALADHIEGIE
jgi:hypothetical protein